jgi:hypothetical protein
MNVLSFVRRYRPVLVFAVFLLASSLLVLRQVSVNQTRHVDLREAFILLHTKGYRPEAQRLYERLLQEVDGLSNRLLLDDFQRTLTLVGADPLRQQPENLVWKYHWTVSNELERRSEKTLRRALKLAREE